MQVDRLKLTNFRNYRRADLSFAPGVNLFIGDNAQGKTNILEAVYFLAAAKPLRAHREAELVLFGEDSARIDARLSGSGREYDVEMILGQKRCRAVNGVRKPKLADYLGLVQAVFFTPDDLSLVRESPAARRAFMDAALCQLKPAYASLLTEHGKLCAQITRILHDGQRKPAYYDLLDDFAYRLCCVGARMIPYRASFAEGLGVHAAHFHEEISGGRETLAIAYRTVSTVQDPGASATQLGRDLWEHYKAHRAASIAAGKLLTSLQRDDLAFTINDLDARLYASQGQARTAAIACKLAERELYRRSSGRLPLLLLDDVLSELDAARRAYILSGIREGQVFITACHQGDVIVPAEKVFHVKHGCVNL